jgi:hypothetical protein
MSVLCQQINNEIAGSTAYDVTAEFYVQTTIINTTFDAQKTSALNIDVVTLAALPDLINSSYLNPYKDDTLLPYYLLSPMFVSFTNNRTAYLIAQGSGNPYAYNGDYTALVTASIASGIASGKLNIPSLDELPKVQSLITGINNYFTTLWLLA